MTREEQLIRLLVRESIKEQLELNELLGTPAPGDPKNQPTTIFGKVQNFFSKSNKNPPDPKGSATAAATTTRTPHDALKQLNDPKTNKSPQYRAQLEKEVRAAGLGSQIKEEDPMKDFDYTPTKRVNYRKEIEDARADGWYGESKKRRKAALR